MGKKTTGFIVAVETIQTECKQWLEQYMLKSEQIEQIDVDNEAALDAYAARMKELLAIHKDKAMANRAAADDPEIRRCRQVREEMSNAARKACGERSRIKDEIYNRLVRMDAKLKQFDDYVAKKAKSKNPFKSKKSLPAARDFIAASRVFHENTEKFFNSIGGVDLVPL